MKPPTTLSDRTIDILTTHSYLGRSSLGSYQQSAMNTQQSESIPLDPKYQQGTTSLINLIDFTHISKAVHSVD